VTGVVGKQPIIAIVQLTAFQKLRVLAAHCTQIAQGHHLHGTPWVVVGVALVTGGMVGARVGLAGWGDKQGSELGQDCSTSKQAS
jgi:hypothetical protein